MLFSHSKCLKQWGLRHSPTEQSFALSLPLLYRKMAVPYQSIQILLIMKVARQRRDSRKYSCLVLMSTLRWFLNFVFNSVNYCWMQDWGLCHASWMRRDRRGQERNRRGCRGAWGFKVFGITLGNCGSLKEQSMILSYPSILPSGRVLWKELSPEMYSCTVIENVHGSTPEAGCKLKNKLCHLSGVQCLSSLSGPLSLPTQMFPLRTLTF